MRHLAAIAALLLCAACGDGQTAPPRSEPPVSATQSDSEVAVAPSSEPTAEATAPASPSETAQPTDPPTPQASGEMKAAGPTVQLWFVREHNRPWLEPESVTLGRATAAVARATLQRLFSSSARDPGLENLLPDGTSLLDVNLSDSVLTVDLDFPDDTTGLGSEYESAAFQQIVHTATQFPTVRRVRILEEGRTPPSGHADWSKPLRRDPNAVAPVIVEKPAHAAQVSPGRVVVAGTANVYEATVLLTLRRPDGSVHKKTFTTATCGTGCRGTWTKTFRNVTTPGRWTLVAAASDPSDGEGPPPFKVKRVFTVR